MLKWILITVLSLQSLLIFGQIESLRKEINTIIDFDTDIDTMLTPGFIIGVIDGDSTFYLNYGVASINSGQKIKIVDIFEIGSVTKVLTSLLCLTLVEEGLISIDSKINDLLPERYINPRLDHLTMWHLINHYSGFPKMPEFFGKKQKNILDPFAHFTKTDLLHYYTNYVPSRRKLEFIYSHTNYALLEIILETKTGLSFHDLMNRRLFGPMGMESSFIDFPENRKIANGYDRALRVVKPLSFQSFGGSEGAKSNISDMCSFIKNILYNENHPYKNTIETQLIVQGETNYNNKIFIANGWHVVDQGKNYNIFTHTGKTAGHNSFVAFIKETKTAVIILCNSSIGTQDLGFLVLRMINHNWKRKV